jgi:hypothetical protein
MQTLPIGRYAQVCYRGCDVEKWLIFGSSSALVTLLRRGMALCRLEDQQQVWVPIGDLERVLPAEEGLPLMSSMGHQG